MIAAPADLIVLGGTIHSGDSMQPSPQAFAVRHGRFSYVGSRVEAMALRGPATEIVDASEKTILPGIVDAHLHLTSLGLTLEQVALEDVRSYEELIARTIDVARNAADEWIVGRGWDQNEWPSRSFPAHEALSSAIPDRAVALGRVDGHALLANARAMAAAAVDESTPDPPGGRILRDRDGMPTGVFIDAAQALIYDKVPKPDHDRLLRATRAAIAECNRWGITAVAEPGCDDAMLAAHIALLESDGYSIRNYAMLSDDDDLIERHAQRGAIEAAYDGRLWIRAIKMYADGALGSRGAALLEPYSDDPTNAGLVLASQSRIEEVTQRALLAGFQVCVHAIGDRANRIVLDAFEAALADVDAASDPRLRIEHAQVIAPNDIARFAKLGVIASVQATHALSDMKWAPSRLGARRVEGAYAWRALLDSGAALANGTDAPVEPVSTARTFYASISNHGETPRAMSRQEALASMTIWAARANFAERLIGSIAPGKYADFVMTDCDWMVASPRAILRTNVSATYVSGRQVFPRD
jgi:predicted amidohydrolase YtcJ